MGVTVCIYHAFGLSGASDGWIFTLQTLLFIAAAFVPLPGAAGAQESGFVVFFHGVFPESDLAAAMLCWRFFTYYFLLIVGFAMSALAGKRAPATGNLTRALAKRCRPAARPFQTDGEPALARPPRIGEK